MWMIRGRGTAIASAPRRGGGVRKRNKVAGMWARVRPRRGVARAGGWARAGGSARGLPQGRRRGGGGGCGRGLLSALAPAQAGHQLQGSSPCGHPTSRPRRRPLKHRTQLFQLLQWHTRPPRHLVAAWARAVLSCRAVVVSSQAAAGAVVEANISSLPPPGAAGVARAREAVPPAGTGHQVLHSVAARAGRGHSHAQVETQVEPVQTRTWRVS